jgi:hypothetical protein
LQCIAAIAANMINWKKHRRTADSCQCYQSPGFCCDIRSEQYIQLHRSSILEHSAMYHGGQAFKFPSEMALVCMAGSQIWKLKMSGTASWEKYNFYYNEKCYVLWVCITMINIKEDSFSCLVVQGILPIPHCSYRNLYHHCILLAVFNTIK